MKRTLSGSILKKPLEKSADSRAGADDVDGARSPNQTAEHKASGLKPRLGGSGSAWKAGALSDAEQLLGNERTLVVDKILAGRQELRIDPNQIVDVVGTDRREDWRNQEAFKTLKDSIEKNGQDTPIAVWPADPDWRPDEREPDNIEGIQFQLVFGRRRHAILQELGKPIRAILVPQDERGSQQEQFALLFMRFRENEERENLSAFERLVSIGEMYENLQVADPKAKLTAVAFANRIGIHESIVSRGRAIFNARDQILHACKNVYDLSHREVEKILAEVSGKKTVTKKAVKPKKFVIERSAGPHKLSLTGQGDRVSLAASGLILNEEILNGLGDVIAKYLNNHGSG